MDTNFGTVDDVKAAMLLSGRSVVEEAPAAAPPVEPKQEATGQPAAPGEGNPPAASAGSEVPPAPAPGKDLQEPSQAAPPEPPPAAVPPVEDPTKATHGFKRKAEKAQQLIDRLQQDIELERGSKSALQKQLADAQAELARLKPEAPAAPVSSEPVIPKMPTRAELEYDDERYDAAMGQYQTDMVAYTQAVAIKAANDALAADQQKRRADQERQEQQNRETDFERRKNAGAEKIADWQDTVERLNELDNFFQFAEDSPASAAIATAEDPAVLIHFFAHDALDRDSAEMRRIAALNPVQQVREIARIEARLTGAAAPPPAPATPPPAAPAAAAAPPPAPAKPPETVPARPRSPKPAVEPIETVGSRAATQTQRPLSEVAERAAAGDKAARDEYFRRRAAGEQG